MSLKDPSLQARNLFLSLKIPSLRAKMSVSEFLRGNLQCNINKKNCHADFDKSA
ncbi:hypothetical protein [Helicobacter sp. T3_23-1056]